MFADRHDLETPEEWLAIATVSVVFLGGLFLFAAIQAGGITALFSGAAKAGTAAKAGSALNAGAKALPVVAKNWAGTTAVYVNGTKTVAVNKAGIAFLLK